MRVAASSPQLTRTLVLEVQAGGPEALQVRRRAYKVHADTFVRLSEEAAKERPGRAGPISPAVATAIVAGINELMLEVVEEGRCLAPDRGRGRRLRDHLRGGRDGARPPGLTR